MQKVESQPLIADPAIETTPKRKTLGQSVSLLNYGSLVIIALAVALGLYSLKPPAAAGLNAPANEFSAARAMKHLEAIARTPRPIGSAEHAAAREYIVGELRAQGLEPEVQEALAIGRRPGQSHVATVRNVIGVLKGSGGRGKAVLLASHYDSVLRGPGAGDDGAAVASMLETLRALKANAPLQNDVIFLFTDAEEAGLLGARAFVKHPLANNVGLVINFDARGTSGPAIMFETSEGNGWLVSEFAKAAPHPIANSLSYDLYKLLPNDTDLSIFKVAEMPGLNFAFIGDYLHYHSTFDTIDRLDQNTLQHQGASALALTRHFGFPDLSQIRTGDATYFDVLGTIVIRYSNFWNAVLTVLVTVVFVVVLLLGLKKGELSILKVALGAVGFLLSAGIVVGSITVLWQVIRRTYYLALPSAHTYNSHLYLIAFTALALAIVTLSYLVYVRFISMPNLALGALLWWVALAIVTWQLLPGANYLLVWPALFSLGALAFWFAHARAAASERKLTTHVVLALCAVPGLILLTPLIYLVFLGFGVGLISGVMVVVVLALSLLVPHLCLMLKANKYVLPGAALLVAIAFLVAGSMTAGFNKERPKPNVVFYGLNADTGEAKWLSTDLLPDEWTSQFFSTNYDGNMTAEFIPFYRVALLTGDAPAVQLAGPTMKVTSDTNDGTVRTISMHLASARQAPSLLAFVNPGIEVEDALINGTSVTMENVSVSEDGWGVRYYGLPAQGFELTLKVPVDQQFELRVVDQSFKLPDVPFRPRPDYMQPGLFAYSETTLVSRLFNF